MKLYVPIDSIDFSINSDGLRTIAARFPGAIGNICQQHPRPQKRDKQQCYGKSYPLPPIIELAKLNDEYDETDHQVYPDRNLETTHTVLPLIPLAMITPKAFVKQPTAFKYNLHPFYKDLPIPDLLSLPGSDCPMAYSQELTI